MPVEEYLRRRFQIDLADGGEVKSFEEKSLNKKGYETEGLSKKEIFDLYDSVMGTFSKRYKKGGVSSLFKKRKRYADGGVASMFRERTRYADGGTYEGVLTFGNKAEITPEFLYQMEGQFGNDQEGKIRRLKDSYQQSIDYAKSFGPNTKFAGGYGLPDLSPEEYIAKKQEELNLQLSQYDDYNKLIKPKIPTSSNERNKLFEFIYGPSSEVPTVDPFSGQQVSAQDQAAFTQPQAEIFPQQELPTVTPEAPFQPYEGQSTPYDFISSQLQNIFNNPAVKGYSNFITGSGNPFQDINQFTTAQQNVINQAIQNATNQGRTNITYADYPQTGIAQLMDDGFTPMEYLKTLGSSMFGNPVDQIKTTLGQFSYNPETNKIFDRYDFQRQSGNNLGTPYDVNINLRNNPVQRTVNVGSSDIGTQALGASVGNLDFATMNALRNNADLLNTITGQTANMANGGLTNTIPPARGPSSQGVESLFTRRYN